MELDIDKIIADYKGIKNIWKVAELHGISGQKVHSILKKNGVDTSNPNTWTAQEILDLKEIYNNGFECGDGKLDNFCLKYNRRKSKIVRKARELGLDVNKNRKPSKERIQEMSAIGKIWIARDGHPKGFLGKVHNEDSRKKISIKSKEMWADPDCYINREEYRLKLSDRMSKQMTESLIIKPSSVYSRVNKGLVIIGNKTIFARSSWEANIAAYFEYLKNNGEIKEWQHEPITFKFEEIKKGVRTYRPDFIITNNDGTQYYEEVKGWMDEKSKTKIAYMEQFFPEVDLRILDEKRYKAIKKEFSEIPYWGLL